MEIVERGNEICKIKFSTQEWGNRKRITEIEDEKIEINQTEQKRENKLQIKKKKLSQLDMQI